MAAECCYAGETAALIANSIGAPDEKKLLEKAIAQADFCANSSTPEWFYCWQLRGNAAYQLGWEDEVRISYNRALSLNPDTARANIMRKALKATPRWPVFSAEGAVLKSHKDWGRSDHWLYVGSDGRYWLSNGASKDKRKASGFVYAGQMVKGTNTYENRTGHSPRGGAHEWYIYNGDKRAKEWRAQTLQDKLLRDEEALRRYLRTPGALLKGSLEDAWQAASVVVISGADYDATGSHSNKVNGRFELVEREVYRKVSNLT